MKSKTIIALLLAACWVAAPCAATAAVKEGDAFPAPSSYGVAGKLPSTTGKVVLYDFWASWCAPCRAALPAYEQLYQKYKARGFEVVAVGTDENADAAAKFLRGLTLTFPVVTDTKQKFVAEVAPPSMPTSYLVGRNGKVISIHTGFRGAKDLAVLTSSIEAALK